MEIDTTSDKEIGLLLDLLRHSNEHVKKTAAIDLEKLSQARMIANNHYIEELIKIIRDLNIDIDQKNLDAGLHIAKVPLEPPTISGLILLLMETLYNIVFYAIQNKNDVIIDKIKEYSEVLINIAFNPSPYAKFYDKYLPQIRAVMVLYYIDNDIAIDALYSLFEIDEFVQIPAVSSGIQYSPKLIDTCLLLSNKYEYDIKRKLYQLVNDPNKYIRYKAQLVLGDLRKEKSEKGQTIGNSSVAIQLIDTKLNNLLTLQEDIRNNIVDLRQELFSRFDINEQRIIKTFIDNLNKEELIDVKNALDAIIDKRLSECDLKDILDTLKKALIDIHQLKAFTPARDLEQLPDIVDDPKLDISHKLKITIPIIPIILSYEGFIESKNGMNLRSLWKKLLKKNLNTY